MNWKKRTVAVTGAGGFIASHLVEALAARGARVRALVRYNSRNDRGMLELLPAALQRNVSITAGDLRDPEAMYDLLDGCDAVFHLGALIAIPYSYQHPREVVETNVLGTLNILQAARRHKLRCVVHTSTSEVYGTARQVPISETHPLQGQSPYSASKIGADKIAESFACAYALPVVTVRPFNTYGPRQSARAVIPTVITQLLAGNTLKLGSLQPTRDFCYVADTVAGFIAAAETDKAVGEVVNLGTGCEISIGALVQLCGELLQVKPKIVIEARRRRPEKSEVERLLADNRKAKKLLGWAPHVPLRAGLQLTIDWLRANRERYRPGEYTR